MRYSYLLLLFLASCAGLREARTVYVNTSTLGPGSSGMAQVDDHSFLAVYDLKNFQKGVRLGLIRTYRDSIRVFPVTVKDWKSEGGVPSDLESIARIPSRDDEYIMAESGNWQGKLGRIFHISFDPERLEATVLGVAQIPMLNRNDIGLVGDQYEGIVCHSCDEMRCNVVLAERGGSEVNPRGKIKWGVLDLAKATFSFTGSGAEGMVVKAPGVWKDQTNRDLTDLFLDTDGLIWASASQDRGDSGPFYSVIYQLGAASKNVDKPIDLVNEMQVYKAFPGYKIEALAGPSSSSPESRFSFGTEDEIYGGTWRPIE